MESNRDTIWFNRGYQFYTKFNFPCNDPFRRLLTGIRKVKIFSSMRNLDLRSDIKKKKEERIKKIYISLN